MTTEECHPEEVQAFATRGLADEGSMQFPLGGPLLADFWQGVGSSETNAGQQLRSHAKKTETTRVTTAPAPCDKAARSGAPKT